MVVNFTKIAAQRTIILTISSQTRQGFTTFVRVNFLMSGYGRTTSTPRIEISFLIDPLPELKYLSTFFFQLAQYCPEIDPNAPKDTPVEAPQTAAETRAEQHVCHWHL